jgi:hypothetical protein
MVLLCLPTDMAVVLLWYLERVEKSTVKNQNMRKIQKQTSKLLRAVSVLHIHIREGVHESLQVIRRKNYIISHMVMCWPCSPLPSHTLSKWLTRNGKRVNSRLNKRWVERTYVQSFHNEHTCRNHSSWDGRFRCQRQYLHTGITGMIRQNVQKHRKWGYLIYRMDIATQCAVTK